MHQKHLTSTNARLFAALAAALLLVTSLFAPAAGAQDDDVEISLIHGIPGLEVDIYADGDLLLDDLVTRTYSLDQINEGYADMHAGINMRGVIRF